MALFNKSTTSDVKPFEKEEVLQDILELLKTEFPYYHVIKPSEGDAWDLLIIRTVSRTIILRLGTMSLHESQKEALFQEIFSLKVIPLNPMAYHLEMPSHGTEGWVKSQINVSEAKSLKRKLLESTNG